MTHNSRHFIEKPKTIEAHQFTGSSAEISEVTSWLQSHGFLWYDAFTPAPPYGISIDPGTGYLIMNVPEGLNIVKRGCWIYRDSTGTFGVCPPEAFEQTYQEVDDPDAPVEEETFPDAPLPEEPTVEEPVVADPVLALPVVQGPPDPNPNEEVGDE